MVLNVYESIVRTLVTKHLKFARQVYLALKGQSALRGLTFLLSYVENSRQKEIIIFSTLLTMVFIQPFGEGSTIMDLEDFPVSNITLPVLFVM